MPVIRRAAGDCQSTKEVAVNFRLRRFPEGTGIRRRALGLESVLTTRFPIGHARLVAIELLAFGAVGHERLVNLVEVMDVFFFGKPLRNERACAFPNRV